MTLDILAHILHLGPFLDRWRRWQDAAARLIRDARGVAERLRRERAIAREEMESATGNDDPCRPVDWTRTRLEACSISSVPPPPMEMACTTGAPVELDAEGRALHYYPPGRSLETMCGESIFGDVDCVVSRAHFAVAPNRCPECVRRLSARGEA